MSDKPQNLIKFSDALISIIDARDDKNNLLGIRRWLNEGIKYAKALAEKKEKQAKVQKSKIEEFRELVAYYEDLENKHNELLVKITEKDNLINDLKQKAQEHNEKQLELNRQIEELRRSIVAKENENSRLAEDLKRLKIQVEEQGQYNEKFISAKLNDIANSLKVEADDYKATQNEEMSLFLGEIYRDKVGNIFKILDQGGVRVNR